MDGTATTKEKLYHFIFQDCKALPLIYLTGTQVGLINLVLGWVFKDYVGLWDLSPNNHNNEGVMGGGCIGGEGRRIPQENFHYINSRLTQGG